MRTKTVRTTITLPDQIYQDLRRQSFEENKSFGEVIADWKFHSQKVSVDENNSQKKKTWQLFQQVAATGTTIDPVDAARAERDR